MKGKTPMADEITLHQINYSKVTFDNGILIIEERTGGIIRHRDVPWSVFNGFNSTGNADSYYRNEIQNHYPIF